MAINTGVPNEIIVSPITDLQGFSSNALLKKNSYLECKLVQTFKRILREHGLVSVPLPTLI